MCIVSKPISHEDLELSAVTAASAAASILTADFLLHNEGTRKGFPTIPRIRKTVEEIFSGLGPTYSKRAYRRHTDSFYKLHDKLFPRNPNPTKKKFRHNP